MSHRAPSTHVSPVEPAHAGPPPSIWCHRDFLAVVLGGIVSGLGSQIGSLALAVTAAVTLQATPGQMAALRATEYVTRVAIGPIVGVWVDRLRRRPILIAANVALAALTVLVAAAGGTGILRVEVLYAFNVANAALGVLSGIALHAYVPSLVPATLLVAANGANSTVGAAMDVVGPGVAGVLVQALGAPAALAIDGLSFLAAALGLALVRTPEPPPPPRAARARLHAELVDGLRTLVGHPVLRAFLATMLTAQFFYSVIMAIYILYLTRDLGFSPAALGVVFGLGGGVGMLAGSAMAAPVARSLGLGRTLVASHLLFGILGIPLALAAVWPTLAAALVFAAEFAQLGVNAVYGVNRTSVQQAVTPSHLRGRVQSGWRAAHALSGALGIGAGGLLGERLGLATAVSVGVIGGLFSFLWLWYSPVRLLRDLPASDS